MQHNPTLSVPWQGESGQGPFDMSSVAINQLPKDLDTTMDEMLGIQTAIRQLAEFAVHRTHRCWGNIALEVICHAVRYTKIPRYFTDGPSFQPKLDVCHSTNCPYQSCYQSCLPLSCHIESLARSRPLPEGGKTHTGLLLILRRTLLPAELNCLFEFKICLLRSKWSMRTILHHDSWTR